MKVDIDRRIDRLRHPDTRPTVSHPTSFLTDDAEEHRTSPTGRSRTVSRIFWPRNGDTFRRVDGDSPQVVGKKTGYRVTKISSTIVSDLARRNARNPGGVNSRKSSATDRASDASLRNRALLRAPKSTLGALKHPLLKINSGRHCTLKTQAQSIESAIWFKNFLGQS